MCEEERENSSVFSEKWEVTSTAASEQEGDLRKVRRFEDDWPVVWTACQMALNLASIVSSESVSVRAEKAWTSINPECGFSRWV